MKVLVLGATGGTGRLIVRFRPGERPFRRGPGSLEGELRSARSRHDRGDARDEGTLATVKAAIDHVRDSPLLEGW